MNNAAAKGHVPRDSVRRAANQAGGVSRPPTNQAGYMIGRGSEVMCPAFLCVPFSDLAVSRQVALHRLRLHTESINDTTELFAA